MGTCRLSDTESQANSKKPCAPRCAELSRKVAEELMGGTTWCEKSHFGVRDVPWIRRVRIWYSAVLGAVLSGASVFGLWFFGGAVFMAAPSGGQLAIGDWQLARPCAAFPGFNSGATQLLLAIGR